MNGRKGKQLDTPRSGERFTTLRDKTV